LRRDSANGKASPSGFYGRRADLSWRPSGEAGLTGWSLLPSCAFEVRGGDDSIEGEWSRAVVRRRSRNASALVPARCFGADRIEVWLRRWALRRMHGPREWTGHAILRGSDARYGRKRSHDG